MVESVWQTFAAVEERNHLAFSTVLMSPQFGIWLARSLRLMRGGATSSVPLWVELGQIHAAAVAAAARGGTNLSTRIPVLNGCAMLPTLGMARFPDSGRKGVVDAQVVGGRARLRSDGQEVHIPTDPGVDGPHWFGLRQVRAQHDGRTLEVWLDDIDPYRDLADPVPARRLDDHDLAEWRSLLVAAWHLLLRIWPEQADAMAAGLSSVVPLPPGDGLETRSASTGDGFGAALISPPYDPETLAVSLVHEFQHIKLGGLLYLLPLLDPRAQSTFVYAPWRDDPRPLSGLLQGIYAFFGISQYWLRRWPTAAPDQRPSAEFEFAYSRRQTSQGMTALRRSPLLTEAGRAFVHRLGRRVDAQQTVRVSTAAARAAWAMATEHRATWQMRHLEPDSDAVMRLAQAYLSGDPVRASGVTRFAPGSAEDEHWHHGRLALHRMRLRSPARFDAIARDGAPLPVHLRGVVRADVAFMAGNSLAAEAGYRAMITNDPDDIAAWSGLAVAVAANRSTPAWHTLTARPELVRAVYRTARASHPGPISPTSVVEWLSRGSAHRAVLPLALS